MAFIGYLLAGLSGLLALLVSTSIVFLTIPRLSSRFILHLYGARRVNDNQLLPVVYMLQQLSIRADLSRVPRLYYLQNPAMLAFSIGIRGDEAVVISDTMLQTLNMRELSAVMAHEISHIANNDTWVMMVADIISRFTAILALIGYMLVLVYMPVFLFTDQPVPWLFILILMAAPNISAIMQLALSRSREYSADLSAAHLTGDPGGLISALNKIEYHQGSWLETVLVPGKHIPDPSLLRSHPKTPDRISRLKELSGMSTDKLQMNNLTVDLSDFKPYHRKSKRYWFRFRGD